MLPSCRGGFLMNNKQTITIHVVDYENMFAEIKAIKQQYPAVYITSPMLIEAMIKHWYFIRTPMFKPMPYRDKGIVWQRSTTITHRTVNMILEVTYLMQKRRGKRLTRTHLIYGLMHHWINRGRPDIFQYLKIQEK